ncbi:MBL fold metallo-hydrolase [Lysobacter korlensis]|uniref:MBL fold metallo-hydrolase n=1 Tax=Lysobacter korlensis TaxID=553636 RepID=A0ABV6RX18_9GAMM
MNETPSTTLTLLGTAGGPGGHATRSGMSSLVTVGSRHYLVDAGDGVCRQLAAAGVSLREVSEVFITHLHDDHTAGLPGLVSFSHTMRSGPIQLFGPPGTSALRRGVLAYAETNASIRGQESRLSPVEDQVSAMEVRSGVLYSDDLVTVIGAENSHYALTTFSEPAHSSLALRFDTPSGSVVFTGDTGESAAVEELARGAHVLVCEMVTAADRASVPEPVRAHMDVEHLSPSQVGRLAQAARVGRVVLSHYSGATNEDLAEIAREFPGEVVAGEDLMRFRLGEGGNSPQSS